MKQPPDHPVRRPAFSELPACHRSYCSLIRIYEKLLNCGEVRAVIAAFVQHIGGDIGGGSSAILLMLGVVNVIFSMYILLPMKDSVIQYFTTTE